MEKSKPKHLWFWVLVIAAASLIVGILTAGTPKAKNQLPALPEQEIFLKGTVAEIEFVLESLAMRPYAQSAPLIQKFRAQALFQLNDSIKAADSTSKKPKK